MNLSEVKKLVDNLSMEELISAEKALIAGQKLSIIVEGNDEGEQLSLILAAIFILERMQKEGIDFNIALRDYIRRVRESIS